MSRKYRFYAILPAIFVIMGALSGRAQKVDSLFFNLYTDSLKKGTFNYINVDGKLDNGRWQPLTGKELNFSATAGRFENNSLFIERDTREEKVTVTISLKADPAVHKTVTIYVKQMEDTAKLKTSEEVMREIRQQPKRK